MMNKFLKELERQYKNEVRKFNFWASIAEKANQRAKISLMKCKTISKDLDKMREEAIQEVDDIVETEL